MNDNELITAVRARRRIPSAVSGLAVVTAAAVVLGLGLSGAFSPAPAGGTSTTRTMAFILVKHANGTATLTLNWQVFLEPSTLQSDLHQDGIPAIVTSGSFCSSDPTPPGFSQVVKPQVPPYTKPPTITIDPAAMPAGTELSFGNLQLPNRDQTAMTLIDTSSYNCAGTASLSAATVTYPIPARSK
jgi:hypothetical protein